MMDFDKIVVLGQGSVVEVGAPNEPPDRGGVFAKLHHTVGH